MKAVSFSILMLACGAIGWHVREFVDQARDAHLWSLVGEANSAIMRANTRLETLARLRTECAMENTVLSIRLAGAKVRK